MSSAETRRERTAPAHKNELTHNNATTRRIDSPQVRVRGESLPYQPPQKRLFPCVAIHFRDGFGQGNSLGASVDTVLRVGAFLNSARPHQCRKPLAFIHRSRGVHI